HELKAGTGAASVRMTLAHTTPELEAAAVVPGVQSVERLEDGLRVRLEEPERQTPALVRALVLAGAEVRAVVPEGHSLEEAYLQVIRGGGADGADMADPG